MPDSRRIIAILHTVEIRDGQYYEEVLSPPDESNEADVTDIVLALGREEAMLIEDDTASSDNLLAELPPDALPQWFQEWDGWHWVEVEESIRAYFREKPKCRSISSKEIAEKGSLRAQDYLEEK